MPIKLPQMDILPKKASSVPFFFTWIQDECF